MRAMRSVARRGDCAVVGFLFPRGYLDGSDASLLFGPMSLRDGTSKPRLR
jgi:hypothetical protein